MSNKPKWFLLFGAAIIVISVTVIMDQAEGGRKATYKNPIEPKMTPQLNLGKMNYDTFCSACHGKTAGGTNKGPTFINRIYHPGHHGDGAFFDTSNTVCICICWELLSASKMADTNCEKCP